MNKNEWVDVIAAGAKDPIWFIETVMQEQLTPTQKTIITAMMKYDRVAVRSAHTMGKSVGTAIFINYYLMMHPDSIVVTTSSSHDQLKNALWRNIKAKYSRYVELGLPINDAKVAEKILEYGEEWYCIGINPVEPDRIMGYHSKTGHILFIIDEASGINEKVFERRGAILTGPHAKELLLGNPYYPRGSFFKAFSTPSPKEGGYHKIHLSAFDSPNFTNPNHGVEGWYNLASQKDVDRIIADYGKDSREYRVRILGEFPSSSPDNVFDINNVDEMIQRQKLHTLSPMTNMPIRLLSIDVARFGDDSTVILMFNGPNVEKIWRYHGKDTVYTAGETTRIALAEGIRDIIIDTAGIGGAVFDMLKATQFNIQGFESGGKAYDNKYYNRITEAWFETADAVKRGEIAWLDRENVDKLRGDCLNRSYEYMKDKLILEPKKALKKRNLPSPDVTDAFAMGWMLYQELSREHYTPRAKGGGYGSRH